MFYRSVEFNRLFHACADVIGKHIYITMDARMFVLNISQLVFMVHSSVIITGDKWLCLKYLLSLNKA